MTSFIPTDLNRADMLPAAWQHLDGEIGIFNPALTRVADGYVMAYRFVSAHDLIRRIATCRLDEQLQVIPGTATEFSSLVEFAGHADERSREWFADPRYFTLDSKTWLVWNDGNRKDGNHQFMVEMSADGLRPAAPARELVLWGTRRKNEKNWAFFQNEEGVWAVYAINPHQIVKVDLHSSDTEVICKPVVTVEWNPKYSDLFGALRGGAQPVRHGDTFMNLVHSSFNMPLGREYVAVQYQFDAKYPFAPVRQPLHPIDLGLGKNVMAPVADSTTEHDGEVVESQDVNNSLATDLGVLRLNPTTSHVVYPTGLVIHDGVVAITGGVNDNEPFAIRGEIKSLEADLQPVNKIQVIEPQVLSPERTAKVAAGRLEIPPAIPVFWWNAKGAVMSPKISSATFQFGNFGDDASPLLISDLTGIPCRQVLRGERKLLAIGSVLHRAHEGDIVWGSGLKSYEALDNHPGGDIKVFAVRGPKTLETLNNNGWDTSRITEMFDPGVLLRYLYADRLAKFDISKNAKRGKIRIVPHFRDELVFKRQRPDLQKHIISADGDPIRILEAMLGAELVISSSLHGLIFAESLGIPAIWIDSPGGEGHFKYQDYYLGSGRPEISVVASIDEALKAKAPELPTFEYEKYLATFPKEEVLDLVHHSYPPASSEMFVREYRNDDPRHYPIAWGSNFNDARRCKVLRGLSGTFTFPAIATTNPYESLQLRIEPFNSRASLVEPRITVETSAGNSMTYTWARGESGPKNFVLPISREDWRKGVTVKVTANGLGVVGSYRYPRNYGYSMAIHNVGTP